MTLGQGHEPRAPKRRWRSLLVVLTIATASLAGASPASGDGGLDLRASQPLFWDGADVDAAVQEREEFMAGWSYELHVRDSAERLRVGVDFMVDGFRDWADGHPPIPGLLWQLEPSAMGAHGSRFDIRVEGPSGAVEQRLVEQRLVSGYSRELHLGDVKPGDYTVTVRPVGDAELLAAVARRSLEREGLTFRLRAKLDREIAPVAAGELLPNLRIIAPFEFGFATGTYTYGPGLLGPAAAMPSCMGEEYEEALLEAAIGASAGDSPEPLVGVRCLRFSAGIENVGDGPLVISRDDLPDVPPNGEHPVTDLPAYQQVLTLDDEGKTTYASHPAGTVRYHATHHHFHFEGAYAYTLFRISGSHPHWRLEAVAPARKLGFNPSDEKLAQWRSFDQCPRLEGAGVSGASPACAYRGADGEAVLGTGWGDVYEWNRSGQYVPFPTDALGRPRDGDYVLQGVADRQGLIRETDEGDNVSYAHIRMRSGEAEVVERGYGQGPFDPHRREAITAP